MHVHDQCSLKFHDCFLGYVDTRRVERRSVLTLGESCIRPRAFTSDNRNGYKLIQREHMKSDTMQPYHRIFYVIGLMALVGILMVGIAAAQTEPSATGTPPATEPTTADTPAPVVVDIASDGTALIRGTVTQANADSLTVDTWGGTWTLRMNDDGTVIPAGSGGARDASAIQVGHFVGAEGRVSQDGDFTIDASFVRDWTTDPYTGPVVDSSTLMDTDTTGLLVPTQGVTTNTNVEGDIGAATETDTDADDTDTVDNGVMDDAEDTDATDDTDDTDDTATNTSSWSGSVDTVREDSFVLTTDTGIRYTVDVSGVGSDDLVDEDGDQIDINDIDENDDVTVEGTYNGIEITPTRVEVDTGLF